jgi:YebC/PmpR family DNA-binding regulatory protein
VAIVVECATDNPTRSVSNMRLYFSRGGGALGTSGSLDFLFERKGVFKLSAEGVNVEELELELIDFGAEEITVEDGEIIIYTAFSDFGTMQKALEERGLNVISSGLERIPNSTTELPPEAEEELMNLIEKIEDDDDVQAVYHNIA